MVENVRGQCGRAAVTRVANSRVELRACRVRACRGVHVVGVNPCAAPAPCPAHYGLCVPVVVTLTDPVSGLGTVQPDKDAILKIVEANRKKAAAQRAAKSAEEEAKQQPAQVQQSCPVLAVAPSQPPTQQQQQRHKDQPSAVDVERIARAVQRWAQDFEKGERRQDHHQRQEDRQHEELVGTLAELAAEKRAGRVAPGPEPPTGAPRHHEAVQLFSELMQTDDVSTIAAQIANQAELIYQTWKTTGLNPNELIRYHSVSSEGSLFDGGEQAAPGEPSPTESPSVTVKPRTPVRSISPAPPGSSPAVPRKALEPALHNGRPHSASPVRTLNTSPRPYVPPGAAPQSPGVQQQQQQPAYPSNNVAQSAPQSPRQAYSSPTSPSLTQGGPRPFVAPAAPQSPRGIIAQPPPPPERSSSYTGIDPAQQQQESPFGLLGDPDLEASLQELVNSFVLEDKARHHAAAVAALASQRPKSAPSSIQEALLRFERQMAITSRAAALPIDHFSSPTSLNALPNTMGTLGRFAQQQIASNMNSNTMNMSSSSASSSVSTAVKRYGGARSDSSVEWSRMQTEHETRSRRSASPNPPVSQPGWNEGPPPNTSTWPLKNKQPTVIERKSSKQSLASSSHVTSSTSSASSYSSTSGTSTSTNYITTLETRVESSGGQKYSGVPLRHKVVTMAAVDQEEERLMHALRTGTLIDDGDHLRPISQVRPVSAPSLSSHAPIHPANNIIITGGTSNSTATHSETTELPGQGRRPKYSISVTVDVDKPADTHQQRVQLQQQGQQQKMQQQQQIHQNVQLQQQMQHQQIPHQQIQHQMTQQMQHQQTQQTVIRQTTSGSNSRDSPTRLASKTTEGDMSVVDFAKVRYQESQQHPHSSQRLDDYRNISTKQIVNGDGRVMMARTRFENGSTSISDSTWRGALGIQADEVGSTLPEFYRRKLRKMRKAGSPEPLVAGSISALPHPELTDQQKAHIRERSQSPTAGYNSAGVAIRPFLTQGSVAERVLIFERAPAEMKPKPASAVPAPEKRRPAISTWRDPDEVRSLAQVSPLHLSYLQVHTYTHHSSPPQFSIQTIPDTRSPQSSA